MIRLQGYLSIWPQYPRNWSFRDLLSYYIYKFCIWNQLENIAILPNFLQSNCLQKNLSSEIEYDLGSESQFQNFEELPTLVQGETVARKRHERIASTPQKGLRRK